MMKFESDLDAPVRIVPTGTPDQLDVWYSEQTDRQDEDPTFDPDNPYNEDLMDCGCESGSCYCDDDGLTDAEADAMTLASAGYGTDEDYGYFGDDFDFEPPF